MGNFDYVFEQHVKDAYRPFIERTTAAGFAPLTLHVSGPLLEWCEAHDPEFLDFLARLVQDGKLELLLAGFDEPILASLPRLDRVEQIQRMRDFLKVRLGATASGLWLTERVWEPELAADLADAGVGYAFVDDRHFLATGFRRAQLHVPWRTESDGRGLELLAIDERLRYLIPFRPPEETAEYLRLLREEGHALAVVADDGEKFGGWPGTLDWVFTKGWLDRFLRAMQELVAAGEIQVSSGADAIRQTPCGGLAYLPTASYREMEAWALPAAGQEVLARLEAELGERRMRDVEGALVRGAHWRNFLVKYAEANRMHKTMVALSALSRRRGDPKAARRAIGRAQCNDAYWHGVFGGLYLPILRNAIWRQLAIAERELRAGEALAVESLDLDGDGAPELWIHSAAFSAQVSPARGGAVEVFTRFADERNLADALTRRRESYHVAGEGTDPRDLPPVDAECRALFVDRMLDGTLDEHDYAKAHYRPLASWAAARLELAAPPSVSAAEVKVVLRGAGLEKTLRFTAAGGLHVSWRWDPAAWPAQARFASELSLQREQPIQADPGGEVWRYRIATVAKSERGLEEVEQGTAVTALWPATQGSAWVRID